MISVNCGALPETLLESELFGHVKGAYTGAFRDKAGLFELANGGTLFLDEIGDISPRLQLSLLHAVDEQEIRRVGGGHTIKVDVRILVATNKNLRTLVSYGKFREDLYYRLQVFEIDLPPLRERRQDIPLLANQFLAQHDRIQGIEASALRTLIRYNWPGNVRELFNALEHALVVAAGEVIRREDLPSSIKNGYLAQGS